MSVKPPDAGNVSFTPQPPKEPPESALSKQIKINIPNSIKWSTNAATAGLKTVDATSSHFNAASDVAISQNSDVYHYPKAEVLKVAIALLGVNARHYETDDEKIKACINCIVNRGKDVADLETAFKQVKGADRAKQKWSDAETNRMQAERLMPKLQDILPQVEESNKGKARELHANLDSYKASLRDSKLSPDLRLAVMDKYSNDLTAFCKLIDPKYKSPNFSPKAAKNLIAETLLGSASSIDKFLTQEKGALSDYIQSSKQIHQNELQQRVILKKFELNSGVETLNAAIIQHVETAIKEKKDGVGNPAESLVKAFQAHMQRNLKVSSMRKEKLISPMDARLLDVQGNFLGARMQEAASMLKLNRDLEAIKQKMEKGELQNKKLGIINRPEQEVVAEIRIIVSTLAALALILHDKKAWESLDKIMLNLNKLPIRDKVFSDPQDPLLLAWESERGRQRKASGSISK